jgi:hypothetical protein
LQQLEDRKSSRCIPNHSKPDDQIKNTTFSIPLVSNELDSDKAGVSLNTTNNYQMGNSDDDDTENRPNISRKRSAAIKLKDRPESFLKSKPKKQRQALRNITLENDEREEDECSLSELKSSVINLDFCFPIDVVI